MWWLGGGGWAGQGGRGDYAVMWEREWVPILTKGILQLLIRAISYSCLQNRMYFDTFDKKIIFSHAE